MDLDEGFKFVFFSTMIAIAIGIFIGVMSTRASDRDLQKLKNRVKHIEHILEKT